MTKNVKKVAVSAILALAAFVLGACSGATPVKASKKAADKPEPIPPADYYNGQRWSVLLDKNKE